MLKNCLMGVAMLKRFVVVPAVPAAKDYLPRRSGFACAVEEGFDLYDTQEKTRLILRLPTRAEAECECLSRNSDGAGSS